MIKLIIFDITNVITESYPISYFIQRLSIKYKINVNVLNDKILNDLKIGYDNNELLFEQFLNGICKTVNVKNGEKDIAQDMLESLGVRKFMIDILLKLKTQGYCLGYMTNRTKLILDLIEFVVSKQLFCIKITAAEVGAKKPSQEIYDRLELLSKNVVISNDEIIFIDDKTENLKPARKMGMKTIEYINKDMLLVDLERYGICV
ncbi:MAG: HAD-IA family hydrolase [bacterium]